MAGLTLTTDATAEPLSTSEAKVHRHIDSTAEDTLLGTLITAARKRCEKFCHRAFITQTWTLSLDGFPACRHIDLMLPPVQSVTSVQYYDLDGTQQTLNASKYQVDTASEPGRIILAPSETAFPLTQTYRQGDTVEVVFVTGYGDAASDVPADIKAAIYLYLGNLWEHRESVVLGTIATKLPMGVEDLLYPYKWGNYT